MLYSILVHSSIVIGSHFALIECFPPSGAILLRPLVCGSARGGTIASLTTSTKNRIYYDLQLGN